MNEILVRPSKHNLSTHEIKKLIQLFQQNLKRIKLIGQSQIDISKLIFAGYGFSNQNIELKDLEAIEIIHYNSNLINETSLT